MKWPASTCPVQNYIVRFWLNGSSKNWAAVTVVNADSLKFTAALSGTHTYQFYVTPKYCNGSYGPNSDTAVVTYTASKTCSSVWPRLAATTSEDAAPIADEATITGVTVYPNPSDGRSTMEWESNLEVSRVELYNFNGQRMQTYMIPKDQHDLQLDIPNLTNGVYLFVLKNEQGEVIERKNWVIADKY